MGRGGLLLLAIRGHLVYLRDQRQSLSQSKNAWGAAALIFLAVRGCLVYMTSGKLHLCLSPHDSVWDAAVLLLWPSMAA